MDSADVEQLRRALTAVGDLVAGIRSDQWLAPTPCDDWSVADVVSHLIGMNLVFTALLNDQSPPERGAHPVGQDPAGAFARSAAGLLEAFGQPGVLERTYWGPLGAATGADRLHIRLYDLLAHGWDLAKATGQPGHLPEDLAAQALTFARRQISPESRPGRFAPAQNVSAGEPAIDRLVAFLGRSVG